MKKLLLLGALLFCSPLMAQLVTQTGIALGNVNGTAVVLSNASVRVCSTPTSPAPPCNTPVTLYQMGPSSVCTTTTLNNPTTSDSNGNYGFCVNGGAYIVESSTQRFGTVRIPVNVSYIGPPGPPVSLQIGTVTTGTDTNSAAVTVRGTSPNQVLDMVYPIQPAPTRSSIVGLWNSCTQGYLRWDGNCDTEFGFINSGNNDTIPKYGFTGGNILTPSQVRMSTDGTSIIAPGNVTGREGIFGTASPTHIGDPGVTFPDSTVQSTAAEEGGLVSINGWTSHSFTFGGGGVSCVGSTCTFGGGGGLPPGWTVAGSGTSQSVGAPGQITANESIYAPDMQGEQFWVSGNVVLPNTLRGYSGGGVKVVTADASGNVAIPGSVAVGTSLSAPTVCVGADCRTAWPTGDGSAASPAYLPTSTINYGDSITAGFSVTTPSNNYVNRITTALGISTATTNRAVSGALAADVAQLQMFPNDSPSGAVPQPLRTLLISTNEAATKGAGSYEATFNKIHQALLSWASIPLGYKAVGSTATTSGTCANDTIFAAVSGKKCTASASTITFSSFATTGGPLYIWYRVIDSDTGIFTYSVDGGTAVAVTTALTPAIATQNGTTQAVALARVTGISAGSHTVTFTQTASGTMAIVAIGTNGANANGSPLIVGDTPQQNNGTNQAAVNAYRADVQANITLLAGDGLPVYLAPVGAYLQMTTAAGDNAGPTGQLHPNDIGHGELAAAFLSPLKLLSPGTALAALQAQVNGGSVSTPTMAGVATYTLLGSERSLYMIGGSAQTLTLPLPSSIYTGTGQLLWIYNYASTPLTIASGGGAFLDNVPTLIPASASILIQAESSTQWFMLAQQGFPSATATLAATATNALGLLLTSQVKSAPYTVLATDSAIFGGSGTTITLNTAPGAVGSSRVLYIFNYDASLALTIANVQNNIPTSLPPKTGMLLISSGVATWWMVGTNGAFVSGTTPTAGNGVCWKTATTLGTCTAGTWPTCTTCN